MPSPQTLNRVSIKDVARAVGMSISTVSRALNDHPDVSEETRERILTAAEDMGYERNPFAHSLSGGNSGLIAIVVYSIDNDYHLQLLRGLSRAAREQEQGLLFAFTEKRQETLRTCASIYRRGVADGAIIFSPIPEEQAGLLEVQQAGFPLVIIHPSESLDGLTSIEPADRDGAFQATQHLLELGHRRIGIILESLAWGAGKGRFTGYRDSLQAAGAPLDEQLVLVGHSGFPESGQKAARHWLESKVDFSAVLCFNDLVAYGFIRELHSRGIRVPQQISVIGFDDIPNSQYIPPQGLTTVRQPITEIGEMALEMLVELINGEATPGEHVHLPMELIVRGSTGPAPPRAGNTSAGTH